MIKNRLLYLGGLLAALIFHIFYFGWYSWYLLVLMLCLPWFVLLISLHAMLRLRLKLTLPEQCRAGDTAFLQLSTGKTKGILPPHHLRLRVKNTLDGKIVTVRPRKVKKLQGKLALDTTHCGILRCSAKGSRVCDYLGLFALPVRGSFERELLVLPRPVPPDPLPNLMAFATGRRRPKPGGGFSEEHELREYREGDNLRNVHWKLSAKTDQLILREAQEPIREQILLTFDLPVTAAQLDSVLSRLLWLSCWLIDHETHHEIRWIDPQNGELQRVLIQDKDELVPLLRTLLSSPLPETTHSLAETHWPGVSWHYHVSCEEVQP